MSYKQDVLTAENKDTMLEIALRMERTGDTNNTGTKKATTRDN
jgi:hypothetical protein